MSCTFTTYEEMAEAGFTEDDIQELKADIALARARANLDAAEIGLTRVEQRLLEDRAEKHAREDAHDRFHRKLADFMESLPKGDAKALAHAHAGPKPAMASGEGLGKLKKLFEG